MQSLPDRTYEAFAKQFGRSPVGLVLAPGRVNIIGEHTDYNDGFVLPMAIDRYIAVAFEPTTTGKLEIWSEHAGSMATILLDSLEREGVPNWVLYASGMVWALNQAGFRSRGARLAVCSSLAIGAGVSSSAAFEVGVGTALAASLGADIPPRKIALLAHTSDHEFVGIPSGIMDQFASACCKEDHALLLDCRDQSFVHVPLARECSFVVIDTGKTRELVSGEYAERVSSCRLAVDVLRSSFPNVTSLRDATLPQLEEVKSALGDRTFRRARHVVTEMARPTQMVSALSAKDWLTAGRLMVESHRSLANDYDVSCTELDSAVQIALEQPDCYGARLTGAGFGGCAIALCASSEVDEVVAHIYERYRQEFGYGKVYGVRASGGVSVAV